VITNRSIQQVLETARIEEVVGDFVQLRKRGVNLLGLCPFHGERTPSFNVNPTRNLFKCFGCGEAGDSVGFLMKHESMTFPEAIRWLAKRYNIVLEEEQKSEEWAKEQQEQESLYLLNDYALKHFQEQLWDTDLGKSIGLGYFKSRGFLEETIRRWGLGYAQEDPEHFTRRATAAGYKKDFLQKGGLSTQSGRDFFRGRVIFPIHNLSGKVAAFAGRILGADKKQPKYINTPESEVYHKSRILFGAFFARNAIRKKDECFLVEGYTDVITLHQAGIENVVASSGTSLTVEQIGLVKRFTNNLTILYDGDAAGIKAALRGVDLVLEQDLDVRVVLFPNGEDPDSFLRKAGGAAFESYIEEHRQDFILFKMQLLLEEAKNDPFKRAGIVREIVQSIALMPDAIKRAEFVKSCSARLDIREDALYDELNKSLLARASKQASKTPEPIAKGSSATRPPNRSVTAPPPPFDHGAPMPGLGDEAEFGGAPFPGIGEPPPLDEWVPDARELEASADPAAAEGATAHRLPYDQQARTLGDEFQEKDLVRLLIEFGAKPMDAQVSVAQYLLADIADALEEFDSELYAKIVREALRKIMGGESPEPAWWLAHPDPEIARLAQDFSFTPYSLSPNWLKMDIYLNQKMPEENHYQDAWSGVLRFKLAKMMRIKRKNQEKIRIATDVEEQMLLLKVDMRLQQIIQELAAQMGTVVL
jgi:DNA primase